MAGDSTSLAGPGGAPRTRKPLTLTPQALIRESFFENAVLPVVCEPVIDGLSLIDWSTGNVNWINEKLSTVGAVLFRGFKRFDIGGFEQLLTFVAGDLLDYSYRSTPRSQVSGKIYTSTEYPAHQTIPLHNEMSYTRAWPMLLGFFCVQPSSTGGETPIADSRKVMNRISPEIRERFAEKQVRYVRNYGAGLDLSWQEVFQTDDRRAVEDYCRASEIEWEWRGDDQLWTSQLCQAVARHPRTREQVWFNQAHLFHVSNLGDELRTALSSAGELPRNAVFGDGSTISDSDLEEIRSAYESELVAFPWREGDVLLVDNMLVAHGRRPYTGERKIVVGMGQLFQSEEK